MYSTTARVRSVSLASLVTWERERDRRQPRMKKGSFRRVREEMNLRREKKLRETKKREK